MTASAIGKLTLTGEVDYLSAAVMLALLSGILGFLANFLSHPVISGFIIAAGLLIYQPIWSYFGYRGIWSDASYSIDVIVRWHK